jgi:hypothetical protein
MNSEEKDKKQREEQERKKEEWKEKNREENQKLAFLLYDWKQSANKK